MRQLGQSRIPSFRHGLGGDIGVREMVAQNGWSRIAGLPMRRAGKRSRLIRIEFGAFRNAGRIGRGETGIDSYGREPLSGSSGCGC